MVWRQIKSAVGRLYGYYVKRPTQRWNVDNRAERAIEKREPKAAPRHETTKEYIDKFVQSHPEIKKEIVKRPDELLSRLKDIKIVSDAPHDRANTDNAKLPRDRSDYQVPEYGVQEPAVIPTGKLSVRMAVEMLALRANDPKEHTVEKLAEQFHLKHEDADAVLTNFQALKLYKTPKETERKPFLGKQVESVKSEPQKIESGESKESQQPKQDKESK